MIAYLKGNILKKLEKGIILDTGNIGYFVTLSKNLLGNLKETAKIELFIHSHIREDMFDLYGFPDEKELNFFKKLLSINGIGPKAALDILSVPSEKVFSAIINENAAFLTSIPGIGQKTAKRIILELKDKLEIENITNLDGITSENKEINDDAYLALQRLGYDNREIRTGLKNIPKEFTTPEEVISFFLKSR